MLCRGNGRDIRQRKIPRKQRSETWKQQCFFLISFHMHKTLLWSVECWITLLLQVLKEECEDFNELFIILCAVKGTCNQRKEGFKEHDVFNYLLEFHIYTFLNLYSNAFEHSERSIIFPAFYMDSALLFLFIFIPEKILFSKNKQWLILG